MAPNNQAPSSKKRAPPPSSEATTPGSTRSLTWLSVVVALLAVLASSAAYLRPHSTQALLLQTQTHVLRFLDQLQGIQDAPLTLDCSSAGTQYLTQVHAVKGFHVLCVKKTPQETLSVTAYKDGQAPPRHTEMALDLGSFHEQLEVLLAVPPPKDTTAEKFKQPMAFFTPEGERLERLSQMVNRVVFLFEGGQFIWPGIAIGHKTVVRNVTGKGDLVLETLSMIPLVFAVEEFLKDDEIDIIMELSLPHLKPSGVTLIDGHENRPATDWRTSTTYFLPSSRHHVVQEIDQRTHDLIKLPISHQEDVQVLRYEETQKYDHHTDYFPADRHRKSPELLDRIHHGYKNRMVTVFWYMSDVAKGGHTIFPRAGGAPSPSSMTDCSRGLKVTPQKRKVVVFYSMLPNGEGDPMSLHGGCPVEDGVKYSGNKWVWNKPVSF